MQETFTHFMNYDLNLMHAEMSLDIKTPVFRAGCVATVGKEVAETGNQQWPQLQYIMASKSCSRSRKSTYFTRKY